MLLYRLFFGVLLVCYAVFIIIILRRPGRVKHGREKSPGVVRLGVVLQSLSFLVAWILRRPRPDPFRGTALWPDILTAAAGLSLALVAVILVAAAKKHLGRHWALAARVIDEHSLVTDGPFERVRHPIYLAMGLLLFAAVVGLSSVPGAVCASLFFMAGTYFRVRAEEGLLAREFGPEFEAYRRRVSAFLPRLRPRREQPDGTGRRQA